MTTVYDFEATSLDGRLIPLSTFRGRVLLIVNVASQCSFTPQYAGLQLLHEQYEAQGFSVLGFPCSQFFNQEFGTSQEIQDFCDRRYRVTFPMFAKIEVNGPNAHPLYQFLQKAVPSWFGLQRIGWNYTKFLIDRQGNPVRRYGTIVPPKRIEPEIQRLLAMVNPG